MATSSNIAKANWATSLTRELSSEANRLLDLPLSAIKPPAMVQEKFDLDGGPVTLNVPATLSPDSYKDMEDRIAIFLRSLKRRSEAEVARRRLNRDDVSE